MIKGKKIDSGALKLVSPVQKGQKEKSLPLDRVVTAEESSLHNTLQSLSYQNEAQGAGKPENGRENEGKCANQSTAVSRTKLDGLNRQEMTHKHDPKDVISKPWTQQQGKEAQKSTKPGLPIQTNSKKQEKYLTPVAKREEPRERKQVKPPAATQKVKEPSKKVAEQKEEQINTLIGTALIQQRDIEYEQEEECEQVERQFHPNPISDVPEQLLPEDPFAINIEANFESDSSQSLNDYSFFPEGSHQREELALNMELFEMTADQLLSLDYFTI